MTVVEPHVEGRRWWPCLGPPYSGVQDVPIDPKVQEAPTPADRVDVQDRAKRGRRGRPDGEGLDVWQAELGDQFVWSALGPGAWR